MYVPLSATTEIDAMPRGWHVTPRNLLPQQSAVLGVRGIVAIADGIRAHKATRLRSTDPAISPMLSAASMASTFAAMLTEEGAHFAAVASPGGILKPADGVTVRARFGELRHVYAVGTSEVERFDKVASHTTSTGSEALHSDLSLHGNPRATIVPGLNLTVGAHIDTGILRTNGSSQETAQANTHLSGRRHRGTTYHLHVPVTFIVVVGDAAPFRVTGESKIIVTEAAAQEMGVPLERLRTVQGTMASLKHLEFALD